MTLYFVIYLIKFLLYIKVEFEVWVDKSLVFELGTLSRSFRNAWRWTSRINPLWSEGKISWIGRIPIRNTNFSIPGEQSRKSILYEPRWCVGGSPSIPNLLIRGSIRFINSTSLAVPLFPGMNTSFVSMQTIISWEQVKRELIKSIKSLIILSLIFSCSCWRSSRMSHCCECVVDMPWLSFGI